MLASLLPDGPHEACDHARRLLTLHGLEIDRVIRVDVDAVLYVDRAGRARTAWLRASPPSRPPTPERGMAAASAAWSRPARGDRRPDAPARAAIRRRVAAQARSKRSSSITFAQAATKSWTNFSFASSAA